MAKQILVFLQYVKLADIADIAIVSVFLYLILIWLKKTRARFIFIGMVILGAIYILARFFGL